MAGILNVLLAGQTTGGAELPSVMLARDTPASPEQAIATFELNSAGTYGGVGDTELTTGTWLTVGAASDYECRMTTVGGSATPSGTIGSWVGLGTTQSWNLTADSGQGNKTYYGTLEIRRASDSVVVDSGSVTIEAESVI